MNAELIKKKLAEYYNNVTSEQVVAEFEAMGVEFVDLPGLPEIQFDLELPLLPEFNNGFESWADSFLVKEQESSFTPVYPKHLPSEDLAGNTQYAMAA